MASYFQTTIHSKNSKLEKSTVQGIGKLFKGTISTVNRNSKEPRNFYPIRISDEQQEKDNYVQENFVNEASQLIQQNKTKSKAEIPLARITKGALVGESDIFPAIFFKKTTMRNVLKQFLFPDSCKALLPNDSRCPLIFQIVGNLFNQITFYIFNLLIGENSLTKSFYIFFSDADTIPFTKCCNMPAYVQLHPNGTGRILCNSKHCQHPSLAEFLVSFQDSAKLWKDITYLQQAPDIDRNMKNKISKFIKTGKYKRNKLQSVIDVTSKQVSSFYYTSKNGFDNNAFGDTPFLTDGQKENRSSKKSNLQKISSYVNEEEILFEDKDPDFLKIKLQYMAKKQKSLQKKMVRGLVEQGKVFNKRFQMMEKLEKLVENDPANKTYSKMTFPKLLEKLKVKEESKSRSKSRHQSFMY